MEPDSPFCLEIPGYVHVTPSQSRGAVWQSQWRFAGAWLRRRTTQARLLHATHRRGTTAIGLAMQTKGRDWDSHCLRRLATGDSQIGGRPINEHGCYGCRAWTFRRLRTIEVSEDSSFRHHTVRSADLCNHRIVPEHGRTYGLLGSGNARSEARSDGGVAR